MSMIRLAYVQEFKDRHGRVRRYFRRPGCKRVPLPGLPGSAAFMQAYQEALGSEPAALEIGGARTIPGTINAAIVGFYHSPGFLAVSRETQRTYRSVLEGFRKAHGGKRIATLQRKHILAILAEKSATPGAQIHLLKTLKLLLAYCVEHELILLNPTIGIKLRHKLKGIHTWTEDEIAQFEACFPIGTKERLAFGLLLYTSQRKADVIKMGRQHIRNGCIHVRQGKTGAELAIPLHPELTRIIEATDSGHLTFLVNDHGKPYSPNSFGAWFRKACDQAGLPSQCRSHGLRKACCRRIAEAGCTAHQIKSVSGHKTLAEVQRYTQAAEQTRLAKDAIAAIVTAFPRTEGRTGTVKPIVKPLTRD
jgi:integrase